MTTLHRTFGRRPLAAAAALLTLGLVAGTLHFTSAAKATSDPSCADQTSLPNGPATVSTATRAPFGKVLVVGSGDYAGCSLYLLTSDQLHALTGSHYACSDTFNAIGQPCDTYLWPALLTDGAPIAGPGVNAKLLGTVTRTDLPGLPAVQQVTYAGQPLYRFFLDEGVGETDGANLFDPVTSPTGTWYLVDPSHGAPAPGPAEMELETAPVDGTGSSATVLSVSMDHGFVLLPDGTFPVYTQGPGHGHGERHDKHCGAFCAQYWPPVLTSGSPAAGAGVEQHALGTKKLPDGSRQVTYKGRPLYLFADDAYIPTLPYGTAAINGAGANTIWGVFDTIPALH
jgi:predicted lipoprotein with Yx(FWY)xxD motif